MSSTSVIFSAGYSDGPTPSDSLDGLDPSGRGVAPVNRFPAPESKWAALIRAIYGQRSAASSTSAYLQSSLESKLRARLAASGSPEYVLTWKRWAMRSGPPICALRASGHRTSDSGSTGWQTPSAQMSSSGRKPSGKPNLQGEALIATGWPTPRSCSAAAEITTEAIAKCDQNCPNLETVVTRAFLKGWPTPRSEDSEQTGAHRGVPDTLNSASKLLSGWLTPAATDEKCRYSNPQMAETRLATGKQMGLEATAFLTGWATPTSRDSKDGTAINSGGGSSERSPWASSMVITGLDGKTRRVEPGIFPLAHGLPRGVVPSSDPSEQEANEVGEARVMRLKGYGNAIVPQQAESFITAFMQHNLIG